MAGSRTATLTRDAFEEVTAGRYLAEHPPVPHLFEISPDLDTPDAATAVASIVRARGDRETDVCLLVDDGERHLALARDLAHNLRCDVYLTPRGSVLRYGHRRSAAAGDVWEAVAVDPASGQPAEWLVVRPAGLPATAATWFSSVQGRLRRGQGLVTVALPGGVAFATRATYRDTAQLAARLMPSGHPLTTLAVNADVGLFEIARFDDDPAGSPGGAPPPRPRRRAFSGRGGSAPAERGADNRLHGAEFAALIRAQFGRAEAWVGRESDVIHPDVQVALTWPKDAAACTALHTELLALAEGLDRTVWVPEPQGAAFVQPGLGEFVAVDEVGSPSRWRAYPPTSAEGLTTLFGTDLDGRLTPLGEVSGARFAGVRFVSVPGRQLEHLRSWYSAIAPPPELFPLDLAVLPDGRLGVMLSHGVSVVAGPRELQVMLREAGWQGEELLLLAQPPAHVWNTTIDHARGLVEGLRADLWLATLGAEVWVQADGTLAADGPDGSDQAWCCVAFGRTAANVTLPAALQVPRLSADGRIVPRPPALPAAPAPGQPSRPPAPGPHGLDLTAGGDLTGHFAALPTAPVSPGLPALTLGAAGAGLAGAAVAGVVRGVAAVVTAQAPAGPGRALGVGAPHGVPWLPASPAVNARPIDLYLWTPLPGDRAEEWTLPSADLFLLAGADPLRLAERRPDGYVLRLRVPERGAVDLAEHARQAPPSVQQRLEESGSSHLLPLAWLCDLRVTARFDLDGSGGVRARTDVRSGELAIRFEGAAHGVTGLPNEVVHWPDKGSRADAPCYVLLPDESRMSLEIVHGGFVALSRRKPALDDGHRLLEVRVRRRRAIDVPATVDSFAGMNIVGRMHDFVGLDVLLPEDDLDKAVVTKIWRRGPGNRTSIDKLSGETLYDALLDESILSSRRDRTPTS